MDSTPKRDGGGGARGQAGPFCIPSRARVLGPISQIYPPRRSICLGFPVTMRCAICTGPRQNQCQGWRHEQAIRGTESDEDRCALHCVMRRSWCLGSQGAWASWGAATSRRQQISSGSDAMCSWGEKRMLPRHLWVAQLPSPESRAVSELRHTPTWHCLTYGRRHALCVSRAAAMAVWASDADASSDLSS